MWLYSFEGWVCAWPRCYALSPTQHRVKGSCIPHIICFNDAMMQTWDRLTKWQTSCLSHLPFAISQATNQIQSFLQAIWSDLSKPSTYTQWYFTITSSRVCLKYDGTRAETRFCLSPKRTSPFNLAGASVQSTAGRRGVCMSISNAGYTTFQGSMRALATHSIRQFPLHFPSRASPCAIMFQLDSNYLSMCA